MRRGDEGGPVLDRHGGTVGRCGTQEGKFGFDKHDMTRHIDTICRPFETQVGIVFVRVSYKDTGSRTRLQFVGRVRAEPGIAQATKHTQFAIVWGFVED